MKGIAAIIPCIPSEKFRSHCAAGNTIEFPRTSIIDDTRSKAMNIVYFRLYLPRPGIKINNKSLSCKKY